MVIKINGAPLTTSNSTTNSTSIAKTCDYHSEKISIISGLSLGAIVTPSIASASGLWDSSQELFSIFQDIAMFGGGIAAMAGLIALFIKKSLGKNILYLTAIVVGGVFLVPSAIMLLAIMGSGINDALEAAFSKIREGIK